ncbi:MAG: redoxin domain-containing protein [bacterium]|nr:redoxin domain-containing protein [bacterium]
MTGSNRLEVKAPELPVYSSERWVNSEPLTMQGLRGKIVMIDFWEYTCINCIRTMPYVTEWHERYAEYDLVIIGVHTPEFEFCKDRANVERAVADFDIEYPVVLDNDYEIWRAYDNHYWPRKYIIDKDGYIIYDHAGEGGYVETEGIIQSLILEQYPDSNLPPIMEPVRGEDKPGTVCYPRTPELYCGYLRAVYGNRGRILPDETLEYKHEEGNAEGYIYLNGPWRVGAEQVTSAGENFTESHYLSVPFSANEINAVMIAPQGKPMNVYVRKDGDSLKIDEAGKDVFVKDGESWIEVVEGKMYRIYDTSDYGSGVLTLHPEAKGLSIFAFTFGSCGM